MTLWNHIKAIVLLPFTVTVVIPAVILHSFGIGGTAVDRPAPWNFLMLVGAAALLGLGLTFFVMTIGMFIKIGRGTLAPWNPPQRLVVAGVYRHVRNPMITGVTCVLLAEAIFFGSSALFGWFVFFALVNAIYIPLVEEPALERRFGSDYFQYKRNVPRWIPRLTPWNPKDEGLNGK
jgi:protein-S-isoprenylcysteine O-methyltransferase Ste14